MQGIEKIGEKGTRLSLAGVRGWGGWEGIVQGDRGKKSGEIKLRRRRLGSSADQLNAQPGFDATYKRGGAD